MRDRKPNFVIVIIWSALIAGGWVVVACSRKSCLGPAEFVFFVYLILFKDGEYRVGRRFYVLFLMLIFLFQKSD